MSFGLVGALGATGLSAPAHATTIGAQVGASHVVLYSFAQSSTDVRDGVTLAAGAGPNVTEVAFEYKANGAPDIPASWTVISTQTTRSNGAFVFDWTVPGALAGSPIDIRAHGTVPPVPPATTPTDVYSAIETGVVAHPGDNSFDRITLADPAQTGFFPAPYAAPHDGKYVGVRGTTAQSAQSVVANVGWLDGAGALHSTVAGSPTRSGTSFLATLDISGYPFATSAPFVDQIPIYAEVRGAGGRYTPDVYATTLYQQSITSVTASPATQAAGAGGTAPVQVHVTDQNGAPIVGAEVRSTQSGSSAQYTNANGVTTFTQDGGTTQTYWANATDTAPYEPAKGDLSATATVTGSGPQAADKLVPVLADGNAFDIDEYATGDVAVQLQAADGTNKNAKLGQTLSYHWVITPFDAGTAQITVPVPDATASAGLASGKFTVNLPTDRPAGLYQLYAGLSADSFGNGAVPQKLIGSLKTGEAALAFNGANPQQQTAGTTATATGSLKLPDGTALPGRTVSVRWTRGVKQAGDDQTPDATLVGGTNNAGTATTDATGLFTAQVADPAETLPVSEKGGKLTATAVADASAQHGIDFIADTSVPPGAQLGVTATPLPANQQTDANAGTTPGQLQGGRVQLVNAAGGALGGRHVTLTVDHGFFVDPALTGNARFSQAPSPGGNYGQWKSMGTSITVTTGADGFAPYLVSIGRDVGFDDDARVTATVTGTAGSATASRAFQWDTINDYNPTSGVGENALRIADLSIVRAPAAEQDGPVDPAPAGNPVAFDVFAKDQFGNLVTGVDPTVTCSAGPAGKPCPTLTGSDVSDTDSAGDLVATSQGGGTWTLQASVGYSEVMWNSTATAPTTSGKTVTGSVSQEWYAVDWAAATYTLTRTPAGVLAPGTTVSEKLVVLDQKGKPVVGAPVAFSHNGGNATVSTDATGTAVYTFVAAKAGTDTVTAAVHDPRNPATVVKTLTDQVQVKVQPTVTITDHRTLQRRDQLVAQSSHPAETAAVEAAVYRLTSTGWHRLGAGAKTVGADGVVAFRPKDRNGRSLTTYKVVFDESDKSLAAESATVTIK